MGGRVVVPVGHFVEEAVLGSEAWREEGREGGREEGRS